MRAVAILAAFALPAFAAPNFQKLAEQISASEREQRRDATHQLLALGAASKPMLAQLIAALDDSDSQVFANAASAIAEIGPDAKDAIQKLMDLIDSRKGRGYRDRERSQAMLRAAYALSKIGEAARPQLIAALKSDDTGLRRGSAKALGMMGPDAKEAVAGLIENLGHADESLRSEAVEALALIGESAVEPLISSLGWPDPKLREGSARALGELGKVGSAASAPLVRLATEEKEPRVLAAAISAMPKVGVAHEQSVPILTKALCDEREELQTAAKNAFLVVRPPGPVAVPALVALLDGPCATRAAAVLGHFSKDAAQAAAPLLAAAKRKSPPDPAFLEPLEQIGAPSVAVLLKELAALPVAELKNDHWVVVSLGRIGGAAVPPLQKELSSEHATIRFAAVKVLSEQGGNARSTQAGILKLAADPEPLVRSAVLGALGPLGVPTGKAVEFISQLIKDPDARVRRAALDSATALGEGARPLSADITRMIDDADAGVRVAAMKAIGSIGAGKEAAALLSAHLADPALRSAALDALGKIGRPAAAVIPQLTSLYAGADAVTRAQVLRIFESVGQDAHASISMIEGALGDADENVRAAAMTALAQVQNDRAVAVNAAIAALKDSARPVRLAAAIAISRIGEQSAEKAISAITPLFEIIQNEPDHTYAMETLRAIRVKDAAAIAHALTLQNEEILMWAAERVARMGKTGRSFIPELEKLRASGNDGLRNAARRAIDSLNR